VRGQKRVSLCPAAGEVKDVSITSVCTGDPGGLAVRSRGRI
jgi:hypothetical protein